jgi:hypothetical protein
MQCHCENAKKILKFLFHLLQMPQWKGFSPLWVRQCAVRLAAWLKDLLQS